MTSKFLRTSWIKKARLGLTKKNRKWRRARGRHNKIRENKKGHITKVRIGFKKGKERFMTNGKIPARIENLRQMEKIKEGQSIIIGSIGNKKRKEIEKIASERKIIILNKQKSLNNEKS